MKFTHGIWFDREHTSVYNAVEVAEVSEPAAGELRALCTTRHIRHRGDTLNQPTITLRLSAPVEGVIACSAVHFSRGSRPEPRFEMFPRAEDKASDPAKIANDEHTGVSTVSGGSIHAALDRNPSAFRVQYKSSANGRALTSVAYQSLQYVVSPAAHSGPPLPLEASTNIADPYFRSPSNRRNRPFMAVSLDLSVGELVYGLGERFSPFVKNGQDVDMWNEDAGTCTNYTYKNVPFYMTNRGYGVFFDHSDLLSFNVQTERLGKVRVAVQGEEIWWMVVHGPTPKEILRRYSQITGRPSLPPAWTFGLYLSTSFLTDYDEKTVNAQLNGMKDREIPVSVLHFDCFWMRPHAWTNFTFDPRNFPDAKAFLGRLHARGTKVCVWINPYIAQDSEIFEEAADKGFLIHRVDGTVWQSDIWQAGMGIVDFTNPNAVTWFQEHLNRLMDIGVDTFKTDFGERIPWEDVRFHNGMNPRAVHNYYATLYNKAVYDAIVAKRGRDQAALFARAATAGGQTMPVHWGGDCESTWSGMSQSLRGGLSLGLSGYGFWSHDIAGFIAEGLTSETPNGAIYKRWVQFGLLSSHSRLHGSHTYRVPWLIDDEACQVLSKFTRLKNKLMPYLFAQAIDCHENGLPLLRAMVVEFPDDRTCQTLDQQYMLGDSLLVAPIFNDEGTVEYYVPTGNWVGLLDGKLRSGPAWFTETFDFFHLPVLVREDRAVIVGKEDRPDYDWSADVDSVVVGKLSSDQTFLVPVPSFSHPGQIERHIKVMASASVGGGVSVNDGMGQGIPPQIAVLTEQYHL